MAFSKKSKRPAKNHKKLAESDFNKWRYCYFKKIQCVGSGRKYWVGLKDGLWQQLIVLILYQNKCHLIFPLSGQNKWKQIICPNLVPNQNKWHLLFGLPGQNKWEQMEISHLVPNQNKCHLVIGLPGQNKWEQIETTHLVPNQNKWHLVIGLLGQNKWEQMEF